MQDGITPKQCVGRKCRPLWMCNTIKNPQLVRAVGTDATRGGRVKVTEHTLWSACVSPDTYAEILVPSEMVQRWGLWGGQATECANALIERPRAPYLLPAVGGHRSLPPGRGPSLPDHIGTLILVFQPPELRNNPLLFTSQPVWSIL